MDKLKTAKEIIGEYIEFAECGLFDTRNLIGDPMNTLYNEDGLQIDICYRYSYFEVFGLTDEEFEELGRFYKKLCKKNNEKEFIGW